MMLIRYCNRYLNQGVPRGPKAFFPPGLLTDSPGHGVAYEPKMSSETCTCGSGSSLSTEPHRECTYTTKRQVLTC